MFFGQLDVLASKLCQFYKMMSYWALKYIFFFFRNRRSREISILKAIENGAHTLFEILAKVYSEVDRCFWIPASYNVRLHVEHLARQDKLPKVIFRRFHKSVLFNILVHIDMLKSFLSHKLLHREEPRI